MEYAYDLESFPNYFSGVFINIENEWDIKEFVIFGDRNDADSLRRFLYGLSGARLCGFNNYGYDDILLSALLNMNFSTAEQFNKLTREIIENSDNFNSWDYRNLPLPFQSLDIQRLLGLDNTNVSLKRLGIIAKWPRIQELPFSPHAHIEPNQAPILLDYNRNDSALTRYVRIKVDKEVILREQLGRLYGINLVSLSNSRMGNVLIEAEYGRLTGLPKEVFKEGRTLRGDFYAGDCISPRIKFETKELKQLQATISSTLLRETREWKYSTSVKYNGVEYNLGVGGLHTQDIGDVLKSTNKMMLLDMDVASYYPSIIIEDRVLPDHIDPRALDTYAEYKAERIKRKEAKDYIGAYGLKILLNAYFGKFGNADYWLYDPMALVKVTINGQLYLLMLAEKLNQAGYQIVSANTDGLLSYAPREKEKEVLSICHVWEMETGFKLDFAHYDRFIQRDVNNYIAQKEDGTLKKIGIFRTHLIDGDIQAEELVKGYYAPICALALGNYFMKDMSPMETFDGVQDIYPYLMTENSSKKFQTFFDRGNRNIQTVQRINRFYASKRVDAGYLYKQDMSKQFGSRISLGKNVVVLNDVDPTISFEDYEVDFDFYLDLVRRDILKIRPPIIQPKLF
jgi:hypothetical protein